MVKARNSPFLLDVSINLLTSLTERRRDIVSSCLNSQEQMSLGKVLQEAELDEALLLVQKKPLRLFVIE